MVRRFFLNVITWRTFFEVLSSFLSLQDISGGFPSLDSCWILVRSHERQYHLNKSVSIYAEKARTHRVCRSSDTYLVLVSHFYRSVVVEAKGREIRDQRLSRLFPGFLVACMVGRPDRNLTAGRLILDLALYRNHSAVILCLFLWALWNLRLPVTAA